MDKPDYFDLASLTLVILGAVNWGLAGLGQFTGTGLDTYNVINIFLGGYMNGQLEALVYMLIGLAGLYQVYFGYQLYET